MFDFFDFFQNFCLPLSINLSLKTSLKPLFAGFSYAFDFGPISPFDFPKIFMRLPPRCIGNTCRLFDRPALYPINWTPLEKNLKTKIQTVGHLCECEIQILDK